MRDFLTIYAYFIIALIAFVAPLILFLLSIFNDGISMVKKIANEELEQIKHILKTQINSPDEGLDSALISSSNKILKESKRKSKIRLNLLKPKRQINRIFYPLFLSLLFVLLEMLVKDHDLGFYSHELSVSLLIISFVFILIALLVLRQVAWAIINTKKIIDDERNSITVKAEQINIAATN